VSRDLLLLREAERSTNGGGGRAKLPLFGRGFDTYTAATMRADRFARLRQAYTSDLAMAMGVLVSLQLFGLFAALQFIHSLS
jgi:hypothetical protein